MAKKIQNYEFAKLTFVYKRNLRALDAKYGLSINNYNSYNMSLVC